MTSPQAKRVSGLDFPDFDDIQVSTKTFTASTNLNIEIERLFHKLPITPYVVIPKKRGRKKKCEQVDPNKGVEPGSIVTLKCEGELRGVELKPKKSRGGKKKKWFRNSITVVIIFDKPINFKVCRNGTFQMTGCKTHEHAELCVQRIWDCMKDDPSLYSFRRGETLETLFIPSMRNIDFSLGFLVDREKLNNYICSQKTFRCLLETSFGYTGVNVKVPLEKDIRTLSIKKMTYDQEAGDWKKIWVTYQDYLDLLTPKEQEAKIKEERYNTFLVFHSGKIIHSGLTADFMRDVYYHFLDIIRGAFDEIEERLEPPLKDSSNHEGTQESELADLSLEEELALMSYE